MKRLTLAFGCLLAIAPVLMASETETAIVAGDVALIQDGFRFTEGPVWHPDGFLLFSDIPANTIYRWSAEDGVSVFREDSGKSNGLTYDREGRLLAGEHWNRRVSRTEPSGEIITIAETYEGKQLNSPNDLVVRSDGLIFFTDPPYGLEGREADLDFQGVYHVRPGEEPVLLIDDFERPNGIGLSPDESRLYVADTTQHHLRAFDLDEAGMISNGEVLAEMENPDGLKVDTEGRIYVTSHEGVVVLAPNGERITVIEVPQAPANCAFGGENNQTLFVTARSGLYRVPLHAEGLPLW